VQTLQHGRNAAKPDNIASKGKSMIPFVTMTDSRGQQISVNPEIVQFVRTADNAEDECLIVFGKDQLLRVRGSLSEVTDKLRHG
jgi:uncharacterized alpha/beta hydrolase family protein